MKNSIVTIISPKDAQSILSHTEEQLRAWTVGNPKSGDEIVTNAVASAKKSQTLHLVQPMVTLYNALREALAQARRKRKGVGVIVVG